MPNQGFKPCIVSDKSPWVPCLSAIQFVFRNGRAWVNKLSLWQGSPSLSHGILIER